jgi:C4-dicarboxylate-specific signal transduction histidine kinase
MEAVVRRDSDAMTANRVAEDLPGILVDRQQFHQVLLDLVMNAIDAMSTVEEQSRILTIWGQRDKLKENPRC